MDVQGSTNHLLRIVLSWDYFELSKKLEETVARELQVVPDTFDSVEHYKSVFEPLILEECCGGIVRGSVEGETPDCHESVIAYRKSEGEWILIRMTLRAGVSEEFKKGDLIILSKDHPDSPNARSEFHALGFVESREGERSIGVRFYLNVAAQAGMESQEERIQLMDKEVLPESQWWVCSLGSISTIVREWIALQHIQCIPFKTLLLSGSNNHQQKKKCIRVRRAMDERIKAQYNQSQVEALYAGLDHTPLVLIQGPPGTGKTHAILGLLSVILQCSTEMDVDSMDELVSPNEESTHHTAFDLWARQAPWIIGQTSVRDQVLTSWVDDDDDIDSNNDCYGLLSMNTSVIIGHKSVDTPRVLVCAPSNSALDEIMHRIMTLGLMDKSGGTYHPTTIRVGVNIHYSVSSISIDRLIEQKLAQQGSTMPSMAEKDKIRVKLLEEADIVGSTLGYSGSTIFHRLNRKFDVVVIDEAAQAVEPTTLVPLMNGAKQVYLVGDPNQLPATVLSARASEYSYSKSLFKRLMNAGYPVHMMNMQYRMNPAISAFPSAEFYGGKLLDAPSVIEETKCAWHCRPYLGPFVFYHVVGTESIPEKTTSITNKMEAEFIVLLYRDLTQLYPELKTQPRVSVITPYSAQVKLIRSMLKEVFGQQIATMVDVNSIDGFQGRQTDIIFYSTVRSTERRKIGFVADEHRLNVGLTRARCSLIIVGNAKSLMRDQRWARLILTTKSNNCFYFPSRPFGVYVSSLNKGNAQPIPITEEEVEALDKLHKGEIEDTSTLPLSLPEDVKVVERVLTNPRGRGRRGRRAVRRRGTRGSASQG